MSVSVSVTLLLYGGSQLLPLTRHAHRRSHLLTCTGHLAFFPGFSRKRETARAIAV